MHVRRGDGVTLRVLIRITPVGPVVLRLSKRRLRRSVILRLRGRNRFISARWFILRYWYRLVVGRSAAQQKETIISNQSLLTKEKNFMGKKSERFEIN